MFKTMLSLIAISLLMLSVSAWAQVETVVKPDDINLGVEPEKQQPERIYSPHVGRDYPDQVLFGDTHFHTELSFDAGLIGTSLDAHDGYKVARG